MHDVLNNVELVDDEMKQRFFKIEREYHKLCQERGAVIKEIRKVKRSEDLHSVFEDADFSIATIKNVIRQGEEDAEKALARKQEKAQSEKKQ